MVFRRQDKAMNTESDQKGGTREKTLDPAGPHIQQTKGLRAPEEKLLGAIELSLIPGLGSLCQTRLWTACPALTGLFSWTTGQLQALGTTPDVAAAIHSRRCRAMAEEIFDWAIREGCSFLWRGDPLYPPLLAEIHDPPLILYARGELNALRMPCLAMVGTRRPTIYGLQMAQGMAADLATRGVSIVSGMARGIDAAAHRGCLDEDGCTIAVFGCGVDVVYPREHRQLVQKILKRGLVLSEFPPELPPPRRTSRSGTGLSAGYPWAPSLWKPANTAVL